MADLVDNEATLALVETESLLQELLSRCQHGIVLMANTRGDGYEIIRRWKGNPHLLAGLCVDGSSIVLEDAHTQEQGASGETG